MVIRHRRVKDGEGELSGVSNDDLDHAQSGSLLAVVERCCGRDAVERLVSAVGGREVCIPSDPREHHIVSHILGLDGARRVAREFGWGNVEVPLGAASSARKLQTAAHALIAAGKSNFEVAGALGITTRTVRRYRRQIRAQRKGRGHHE